MAARTRLLQLAIAIVNIVIAALLFTSIWPFPSGDVKVDLPSASEVQWTYNNGVVHVTAPFSIGNGGFWDIDELTVEYEVTNYSHEIIAGDILDIGTIKVGQLVSSYLDFEFDLLSLYDQGITWMIFNDDMLNFFVEVSCGYTMKMVKFDATYQVSVPWDALIQDYGIRGDPYFSLGPPLTMTVNYSLTTSHLLGSLPPAQVTVSYFADTTLMGQAAMQIQLGGVSEESVTMTVTPALASTYTLVIEITLGGLTYVERIPYSLPPGVIP